MEWLLVTGGVVVVGNSAIMVKINCSQRDESMLL